MTPDQLLAHAETVPERHGFSVTVKSVKADEQIVTGEVYAPYVVDSHGDMMLPDDVKLMAHRFLIGMKNDQIDIQHNNIVIKASVIESFIARDGDPDYNAGAWVLSVKIEDANAWSDIKGGEYSAYSFEALVRREEAVVEMAILNQIFGYTETSLDHEHAFFVKMNDQGKVIGGYTSEAEDGHSHTIMFGTATETTEEHSHRFFLP